jgi:hypothetical protein
MLNAAVVFAPIPPTNIARAAIFALISLAYLEEEGLVRSIALAAALLDLGVAFVTVWELVVGAKWVAGLW